MSDRSAALARLDALGVAYELSEHPAVFTIEDMEQLGLTGSGTVCKNLFLRDAKGRRHFLVVIPGNCRADLKSIETQLGSTRLSFASAERLQRYLGLIGGEVTPLGIINDPDAAVEVVFDRQLKKSACGRHRMTTPRQSGWRSMIFCALSGTMETRCTLSHWKQPSHDLGACLKNQNTRFSRKQRRMLC